MSVSQVLQPAHGRHGYRCAELARCARIADDLVVSAAPDESAIVLALAELRERSGANRRSSVGRPSGQDRQQVTALVTKSLTVSVCRGAMGAMSEPKRPSDMHPALSDDHLQFIAKTIAQTRRDAVDDFEPDLGETNWSLGARTHERICRAFERAVVSGAHSWLRVIRKHQYCLLLLDGVPVKTCRADPTKPPARATTQLPIEIAARQRALKFAVPTAEVSESAWRIFYETDAERLVWRATLVRLNNRGEVCNSWDIDLASGVATLAPITDAFPEPVDQPEPTVGLIVPDSEVGSGDGDA